MVLPFCRWHDRMVLVWIFHSPLCLSFYGPKRAGNQDCFMSFTAITMNTRGIKNGCLCPRYQVYWSHPRFSVFRTPFAGCLAFRKWHLHSSPVSLIPLLRHHALCHPCMESSFKWMSRCGVTITCIIIKDHLGFGVRIPPLWDHVFGTMFDLKKKGRPRKVQELMFSRKTGKKVTGALSHHLSSSSTPSSRWLNSSRVFNFCSCRSSTREMICPASCGCCCSKNLNFVRLRRCGIKRYQPFKICFDHVVDPAAYLFMHFGIGKPVRQLNGQFFYSVNHFTSSVFSIRQCVYGAGQRLCSPLPCSKQSEIVFHRVVLLYAKGWVPMPPASRGLSVSGSQLWCHSLLRAHPAGRSVATGRYFSDAEINAVAVSELTIQRRNMFSRLQEEFFSGAAMCFWSVGNIGSEKK